MTPKWLLVNAGLLEAGSLGALLYSPSSWSTTLLFASTHASAALSLAAGCWLLLPRAYKRPLPWSLLFLFLLVLFIPLVGVIGVLLGVLPALHLPQKKKNQLLQETALPELPFQPSVPSLEAPVNAGYLHDMLRHAVNPNKRLTAILSTRRMNQRDAIPILKLALKDPVDDVRLLAYTMLDSIESRINQRIKTRQDELGKAPKRDKASLHASLAHDYWELAYLGLSQGSVLKHVLRCADQHIQATIALRSEGLDWMLAGRIALEQERTDDAERCFIRADALGIDITQLAGYRAEIAFIRHRFAEIPLWLSKLNPTTRRYLPFSALAKYWKC